MNLANPNEQSLSNGVGESESASVESEQVKWALDFGRFPEKKRVWKAWILYLLVFVCVFVQKFPTSPRRRNFQTKNSAQKFSTYKISQSVIHMYEFLLCVCIQIWLCVCGTSSCSCMTISLLHSCCCWQRCFCCLSIGLKLTSAVWLRRRQSSNCKNSLVVADVVLLLLLRLLLLFLCMVGIIYFFHRKMYVKYKTGKQRIQTRTFTHTHEHTTLLLFHLKALFYYTHFGQWWRWRCYDFSSCQSTV